MEKYTYYLHIKSFTSTTLHMSFGNIGNMDLVQNGSHINIVDSNEFVDARFDLTGNVIPRKGQPQEVNCFLKHHI